MNSYQRGSFKRDAFSLSKTVSHDSCLDQIDETFSYTGGGTGHDKNSKRNSKRRSTIISASSRTSLMDVTKSNTSNRKRLLSFIQKGFHGNKSKSMSKVDYPNFLKIMEERKTVESLKDVIPIPIRETAIQGHSKTLFHRIPKSNVRPKPLLKLINETRFISIHSSLLSKNHSYCVKIISLSPNVYRNCSTGNKYEIILPSGTRSLGHTCHIVNSNKLQEPCPSCHSSQLSLFNEEQQPHMMGYLFSCPSETERRKWLSVLTRVVKPNQQNERRKEISLNLWIQEAKNVSPKKRYFCEIYLDETLHARTTTKPMTDMLFWGEEFNLRNLEEIKNVNIFLWKANSDKKKKKPQDQLTCQISIDVKDVEERNSIEKWYSASYNFNLNGMDSSTSILNQSIVASTNTVCVPISQSIQLANIPTPVASSQSNDHIPMIRVKARYQNLEVLPLDDYSELIQFLEKNSVPMLIEIESYLKVKHKEDISENLISILHKQGKAVEFVSDLMFHEIIKSVDQNMILRGNSMASKAIEVYIKLLGEKYLSLTLSDFVNRVIQGDDDCEVDPQKDKHDFHSFSSTGHSIPSSTDKYNSPFNLKQRQESLLMNVDMVWAKIMSSSIYFPKDLKSVFVSLRARLEKRNKSFKEKINDGEANLTERIVSACIFLRYICPAILTPSLFGLIPEYPNNPKIIRTFTLVAKCIQSLANFSDLTGSKETYMVFMNSFFENKFPTMHLFLKEISVQSEEESSYLQPGKVSSQDPGNQSCLYWENLCNTLSVDTIDLAVCLAKLHRQLEDCLKMIPIENFSKNIEVLHNILNNLNGKLCVKPIPSQSQIKYSQSYQEIKLDNSKILEQEMDCSNEIYGSSSTLTKHSDVKPKVEAQNHPVKVVKTSFSKVQRQNSNKPSSISYSADVSPSHTFSDNNSTNSTYLMTQSMIDPTEHVLVESPMKTISKEQVNKEWQEMVSKSNIYAKPADSIINKIYTDRHLQLMNNDSSGYQTMSRSTCNISRMDEMNVLDKLSLSSFKQSVKKCKQYRKQTDVPPHSDNVNLSTQKPRLKMNDSIIRCSSSEEINLDPDEYSLSYQNEVVDSCSTETITCNNIPFVRNGIQSKSKQSINSSISMPSFHCRDNMNRASHIFDDFERKFRQQQQQQHYDARSSNRKIIPSYSFQFNEETNPHSARNIPNISFNETKINQMKMSLNNLHQTFNARMTELLLADHKTIQLELERVRLLKHICETATGCTFDSTRIIQSIETYRMPVEQDHFTKRFQKGRDAGMTNGLSVRKYLDTAECILMDAQSNHIKGERNKKEIDNLIMQIFETNQCLQNSLINQLECPGSSSDFSHVNQQQSSTITNSSQVATNGLNSKSNDLASLNMNSKTKTLINSSSSTVVELVDAV